MNGFTTPIRLEIVSHKGNGLWRVHETIRYRSTILNDEVIVPVGHHTDLASVPRVPLVYILLGGTAMGPAVLHDWLLEIRTPRKIADQVFREACISEGIVKWKRTLMYLGVRLGSIWHARRGRAS